MTYLPTPSCTLLYFLLLVTEGGAQNMRKLKDLKLPAGCHVQVSTAEKIGAYYPYFGVTGIHDEEETIFGNDDLLMVEFTILEPSTV